LRSTYEAELSSRHAASAPIPPTQQRAIDALERCATEWSHYKQRRSNALKKLFINPEIPRGVYMYGGVGRGKSFLMDCFFNAVPLKRKTRLHFTNSCAKCTANCATCKARSIRWMSWARACPALQADLLR
jgi:cell division protein ZapE